MHQTKSKKLFQRFVYILISLCVVIDLNGCTINGSQKCQFLRAKDEQGNSVGKALFYVGAALIVNELAPECKHEVIKKSSSEYTISNGNVE